MFLTTFQLKIKQRKRRTSPAAGSSSSSGATTPVDDNKSPFKFNNPANGQTLGKTAAVQSITFDNVTAMPASVQDIPLPSEPWPGPAASCTNATSAAADKRPVTPQTTTTATNTDAVPDEPAPELVDATVSTADDTFMRVIMIDGEPLILQANDGDIVEVRRMTVALVLCVCRNCNFVLSSTRIFIYALMHNVF